jgi:hypothetical protein
MVKIQLEILNKSATIEIHGEETLFGAKNIIQGNIMKIKKLLLVGLLVSVAAGTMQAMQHDQEDGMRTPPPAPAVQSAPEQIDYEASWAKKRRLEEAINAAEYSPIQDASIPDVVAATAHNPAAIIDPQDQRLFVIGVFYQRSARLNKIRQDAEDLKSESHMNVKLEHQFATVEARAKRSYDKVIQICADLTASEQGDALTRRNLVRYNLLPVLDGNIEVAQGAFGQPPVITE